MLHLLDEGVEDDVRVAPAAEVLPDRPCEAREVVHRVRREPRLVRLLQPQQPPGAEDGGGRRRGEGLRGYMWVVWVGPRFKT